MVYNMATVHLLLHQIFRELLKIRCFLEDQLVLVARVYRDYLEHQQGLVDQIHQNYPFLHQVRHVPKNMKKSLS